MFVAHLQMKRQSAQIFFFSEIIKLSSRHLHDEYKIT